MIIDTIGDKKEKKNDYIIIDIWEKIGINKKDNNNIFDDYFCFLILIIIILITCLNNNNNFVMFDDSYQKYMRYMWFA
jgi:hypothetical protein